MTTLNTYNHDTLAVRQQLLDQGYAPGPWFQTIDRAVFEVLAGRPDFDMGDHTAGEYVDLFAIDLTAVGA